MSNLINSFVIGVCVATAGVWYLSSDTAAEACIRGSFERGMYAHEDGISSWCKLVGKTYVAVNGEDAAKALVRKTLAEELPKVIAKAFAQ